MNDDTQMNIVKIKSTIPLGPSPRILVKCATNEPYAYAVAVIKEIIIITVHLHVRSPVFCHAYGRPVA